MTDTDTCDGCGTEHTVRDRFERPVVMVEIAPGKQVTVCRSSRYSAGTYAKASCLEKARKAARVCPGCGDGPWEIPSVCQECRRRLDQAKEADSTPLIAVRFHYGKLMPYLRTEDMEKLGNLIVDAVQGRGARSAKSSHDLPDAAWGGTVPAGSQYSHDRIVEVTASQKAAIVALAEEIFFMMQAQWRAGYEEGHNLLHGLAVGRVSADDYRDDRKKKAAR